MYMCVNCSCMSECACGCVHVQGESQLSLPGFTDRLLIECVDMHDLDAGKGFVERRIATLTVEHWYITLMKSKYTTHTLYLHTYIHNEPNALSWMFAQIRCLPSLKMWHPNLVQCIFVSTHSEGWLKCAS